MHSRDTSARTVSRVRRSVLRAAKTSDGDPDEVALPAHRTTRFRSTAERGRPVDRSVQKAPACSKQTARPRASKRTCMYTACMPNVQVRDVPDDVHEALVRRAKEAGQSLQQYLAVQLATLAATPTLEEILARIEERTGGHLTAGDSVAALQAERDCR